MNFDHVPNIMSQMLEVGALLPVITLSRDYIRYVTVKFLTFFSVSSSCCIRGVSKMDR